MEEISDITSDMINKLKKLNINSVYQLAVQNPVEFASEFKDTSINVESASILIANARKILIENGVLTNEFSTADEVLEKRNKLTRYAIGSEDFDDLLNGGFESQAITELSPASNFCALQSIFFQHLLVASIRHIQVF
jgi:DNA repair protein RadA